MDNEKDKLKIDEASLINLRAELLKKQEEFKSKRIAQGHISENKADTTKKFNIWSKKNKEALIKTVKLTETKEEAVDENAEMLKKSALMLEEKARYYEELMKGSKAPDQNDEELFLVDFEKKIHDKIDEEDEQAGTSSADNKYASFEFNYDDVTDKKFKLKSTVDEETYKDELRKKWNEEMQRNKEKSQIHYQDIKFDEARNLGVGYFKFSTREEERKKQMSFFDDLKKETTVNRISAQLAKKSREEILNERLRKVRIKKMLSLGYTLEEIDEFLEKQKEEKEKLQQAMAKKEPEEDTDNFYKIEEKLKTPALTREWDKPKLKEPMWNKVVSKLREERVDEFAPPSNYQGSKGKKTKSNKDKYHETPEKKVKKSKETMEDEQTYEETAENPSRLETEITEQTQNFQFMPFPPPPALPPFAQSMPPPEFFTQNMPPNLLMQTMFPQLPTDTNKPPENSS